MNEGIPIAPPSRGESDVLLIRMPFGALDYPSIGLSLLKAGLTRHAISAKILYLSAKFGAMAGPDRYKLVSLLLRDDHSIAGDWLFTEALYGKRKSGSHHPRFLSETTRQFARSLEHMRRKVDRFLDIASDDVTRTGPRIVGFSCVYQQRVASLALAKRIKAHRPETFVVFGGPECESVKGRELLHRFPFVDAVVPGEGDIVFPLLAERVLRGEDWADLEGVCGRQARRRGSCRRECGHSMVVHDLDALPFPDYDDYFEQLEETGIQLHGDPILLVEGSRGCWWGKCRFCSLNGADATYRSKSANRLLEEIEYLNDRYGSNTRQLFFVDNILNMRSLRDLFPLIAERQLGLEMSLEIKSNLRKRDLWTLHAAGVTRVQPGIESLSTPVLDLMSKGVNALQNIQLLKWCKELRVKVSWNIIWGFPGERPDDYVEMTRLCPLLTHLDPPTGFGRMALGRHSAYYRNAAELGLVNVIPDPAYYDVFPFEAGSVASLAEFFMFDYRDGKVPERYVEDLRKAVHAWIRTSGKNELFYVDAGEQVLIWDERDVAGERLTRLSGVQADLYRACAVATDIRRLQAICRFDGQAGCSLEELEVQLQPLLECGLMIREESRYLSLAIAVGVYSPRAGSLRRFRRHLANLEAQARHEALLTMLRVRELPAHLTVSHKEVSHCLERLLEESRRFHRRKQDAMKAPVMPRYS